MIAPAIIVIDTTDMIAITTVTAIGMTVKAEAIATMDRSAGKRLAVADVGENTPLSYGCRSEPVGRTRICRAMPRCRGQAHQMCGSEGDNASEERNIREGSNAREDLDGQDHGEQECFLSRRQGPLHQMRCLRCMMHLGNGRRHGVSQRGL